VPSLDLNVAAVIAIVVSTYVVLALGQPPFVRFRVDRTGAAVIGAILMVAVGRLSLDEAWQAIDHRTIIMLFGMMVLVASLGLARLFRVLARWIVGSISHPVALLVAVVFSTGALSALFVNDTICLVFTPVLIEIARARGQRPLPYLLALATASNIGSVAAITGNPQNMLIGSLSGIPYRSFTAALAPVALFGLAADTAIIAWLFRRDLTHSSVVTAPEALRPVHRAMILKGGIITAGVLVGFVSGLDPALVSACAAAAVLLTRRVKPAKIYQQVDGGLLALFMGLFVVVRGLERAGIDTQLFAWLQPIGVETVWGLSVVTAALSNLVSNVPAVMLFTRLIPHLPDPRQAWLTLAMASTLAGNLTILGSIANLIVVEGAGRHGVTIKFLDYLRVGLPVTLISLAFGIWWLS
jgi:Na+/H+ antiporter NhaD/arsenite permease-like protein